jgi:dephospho-CoA kinase
MKVIGITGGIGAGKTAVLSYMEKNYNCRILLADEAAHQVKEPGETCYFRLVELLGKEILDEEGRINRQRMAEKIFASPGLLARVNGVIHPAVKERILSVIRRERKASVHDFLVIEAALLIEEGYLDVVDVMWYVHAGEETRRKRLKKSRGYSDEKIDSIMTKQLSEEQFRQYCQVVIDNDLSFEDTCRQVDQALESCLTDSPAGVRET